MLVMYGNFKIFGFLQFLSFITTVSSLVLPEKLNCPWQPHNAMNAWINEIRYSGLNPAVEISVLHFASVSPFSLWAVALTNQAQVLSSISLVNCSMHSQDRTSTVGYLDLYVCKPEHGFNVGDLSSQTGGGFALVQTPSIQNAFEQLSSQFIRVLDYLSFGDVSLSNFTLNAAQYEGTVPCPLPDSTQTQVGSLGKSIQLVNGAGLPSLIPSNCSSSYALESITDLSDMRWISEQTHTFGDLNNFVNNGEEPYHIQSFVCDNPHFQNVNQPVQFSALMSTAPLEAYTTNLDCKLGLFNAWSPCISSCGSTFGVESRSRPVFQMPTGTGRECSTLGLAFETRSCTVIGQSCLSVCFNGLQDGDESDIDCGGGIPNNPLDVNSTLSESAKRIFPMTGPVEPLREPLSQLTSSCARCTAGRSCTSHSDCNRDAGLLCFPDIGVCQPHWLINVPFWMSINVTVVGISPMDLNNNTNAGVNVLRNQITTNSMEGFISNERLANTTIGRFIYSSTSSSLTARRLNTNLRSLQGSLATDTTTVSTVLVAADTFFDASTLGSTLSSSTPRVAFEIESTLREQGMLSAHDVLLSSPIILSAAAAGTSSSVTPFLTTTAEPPIILPINAAPEIVSPAVFLSAGAIAGIVIGSVAFAAIIGMLALVAVRIRESKETEKLRLEEITRVAQEQARLLALSSAAGTALPAAIAPTLIRVSRAAESRTKEIFQPTQAGETHTENAPLSPTLHSEEQHVPILAAANLLAPVLQSNESPSTTATVTTSAANADTPIAADSPIVAVPPIVEVETVTTVVKDLKKDEDVVPSGSVSDVGSIGSNTTDSIGSKKSATEPTPNS
jgi:hypothetical protein